MWRKGEQSMQIRDYITAGSLAEAYELYEKGDCILFAGGTDLMVKARDRAAYKDKCFLDISRLKELSFIREEGGEIVIGAAVTLSGLLDNALVREKLPLLSEAVFHVGNCQVRNRGTLAGNAANGCPASDCIPALMVLNAAVTAGNGKEKRRIPIGELYRECKACLKHEGMLVRTCFYPDPCRSRLTLLPGEIIEEIRIPVQSLEERSGFYKLTKNRSSDMAVLNAAMKGELDEDGRIQGFSFCAGGVFAAPVCPGEIMEIVNDQRPSPGLYRKAAAALRLMMEQKCRGLAGYDYKYQALPGIMEELFERLFGEGKEDE